MWNDFWQTMSSEWTARGAVAALISALVFLVPSFFWLRHVVKTLRGLHQIPVRILVTGSRGKSSLVRHLHAVMTEAGLSTYAKTTGTAAVELSPYSVAIPTSRKGQVSVLEMIETVKRAEQYPRPIQVMVFECMAVSPRLIKLVAERFFQPNIVIITNALLDHLEEEGKSHLEIADSLANAIWAGTSLVISGDTDEQCLDIYRLRAEEVDAEFRAAKSSDVPAEILSANTFLHPSNVSMVWEAAKHQKISTSAVVAGLAKTSREPSDRTISSWRCGGTRVQVIDFGSINDIESLGFAASFYENNFDAQTPKFSLLVNRWDRPLRALSFAGSLNKQLNAGVVLVGDISWLVKKMLLKNGWKSTQVLVLTDVDRHFKIWQRKLKAFLEVNAPSAPVVNLLLLENIHNQLADQIRTVVSGGHRHE